jgi:tetrahydromethanopterin S-methyltransferase subunit E
LAEKPLACFFDRQEQYHKYISISHSVFFALFRDVELLEPVIVIGGVSTDSAVFAIYCVTKMMGKTACKLL